MPRLPVLDGYRAASILLVMAGHMLPLGPKWLRLNETIAATGMTMFFSLSGFLIASQLMQYEGVQVFLVRRFARILPLAILYTTLAYLIFSFQPATFLFTNLFVVNYLTQYLGPGNGHFWSLCVEVQFYLGAALVVTLWGRSAVWLAWPACIIVTLLRIEAGAEISINTHLRVDEILVGSCLATTYAIWSKWRHSSMLLLVGAFAATAITCWPAADWLQYFRPYFTAFLFLTVARLPPVSFPYSILVSSTSRYIAKISYALYIIHPATTHGILDSDNVYVKYFLKRPISIVFTFSLAHLSTFYWESLWIKWSHKSNVMQPPLVKTHS
jgi:peptidoglycan/LPS O-acetylase OafA/YrhL